MNINLIFKKKYLKKQIIMQKQTFIQNFIIFL